MRPETSEIHLEVLPELEMAAKAPAFKPVAEPRDEINRIDRIDRIVSLRHPWTKKVCSNERAYGEQRDLSSVRYETQQAARPRCQRCGHRPGRRERCRVCRREVGPCCLRGPGLCVDCPLPEPDPEPAAAGLPWSSKGKSTETFEYENFQYQGNDNGDIWRYMEIQYHGNVKKLLGMRKS